MRKKFQERGDPLESISTVLSKRWLSDLLDWCRRNVRAAS